MIEDNVFLVSPSLDWEALLPALADGLNAMRAKVTGGLSLADAALILRLAGQMGCGRLDDPQCLAMELRGLIRKSSRTGWCLSDYGSDVHDEFMRAVRESGRITKKAA